MFRKLILAFALVFATVPTRAEVFTFGDWRMTSQLDGDGDLMCLMSAYWPDGSHIFIKSFVNEPFLQVEVSDPRWRLNTGTTVKFVVHFDSKTWTVPKANVNAYPGGESYLHALVGNHEMADWLKLFAFAKNMRITFPGSREEPWILSANGSAATAAKFIECIETQEETAPPDDANPNPFDGNAPAASPSRNPFSPVRY